MLTGQTDMVITEKLSLHKRNIIGGGKQTEFSINYGSHETTMVNIIVVYSDGPVFQKLGFGFWKWNNIINMCTMYDFHDSTNTEILNRKMGY